MFYGPGYIYRLWTTIKEPFVLAHLQIYGPMLLRTNVLPTSQVERQYKETVQRSVHSQPGPVGYRSQFFTSFKSNSGKFPV